MADRSLDDIIKERKFTFNNNRRGRGRGQNITSRGRGRFKNRLQAQNNRGRSQDVQRNFEGNPRGGKGGQTRVIALGVKSRLGNVKPITDAREKLIAKARTTDARVKLIQKAKQVDARTRLNAKRVQVGPKGDDNHVTSGVDMGGLTWTIPNEGQRNQSLQLSPQTKFTVNNPHAQKFTVRNTSSASNFSVRKRISPPRSSLEGLQMIVANRDRDAFGSSGVLSSGSLQRSSVSKTINLRPRTAMDRLSFNNSSPPKIQRVPSETSGPLRLTSPIRGRPAVDGTRVVISNLQNTVTEDDIKELFGALGVLKRVRMVKQGLGEVVYSKRESALKAISTYHNRELDGKAMQCRLDTSSVGDAVPFKKNAISDRFKTYSSDNNPTLPYRSTISPSTVVELGSQIVDKVLFKMPVSSTTSKPVIFTVKI